MARSDVAVVVPWRGGCVYREAALGWCAQQWGWPLVIGEHHEGGWCKAAAIADGLAKTTASVLVIADADVWCPSDVIVEAVANGRAKWGHPHRGVRRLHEDATNEVLRGELDPRNVASKHLVEPPTRAHPGGGVLVISRASYEQVPFDRRFRGWGSEDDSIGWALATLAGQPARGDERLVHLWHPPQERRSRQRGSEASYALQEQYWAARRRPREMAELVAAGR